MLQFIIEDVNSVLMGNRLNKILGCLWFLIWVLSMEFIIMSTEDNMDKFGDIFLKVTHLSFT